jgi:DNA-binding beta-propeller fold protein YncE/mono/diheme cytochrome c family protein
MVLLARLTSARRLLAPIAAAATLALTPGCGKAPNADRSLLHFAHTLPEAPRPLQPLPGASIASARATGGPIAYTDGHLLAVDRDNGTLVRLALANLAPEATVAVGPRPEQLVVTPSGDIWVSLRGTGELVRLNPYLEITERLQVGVDAFGLALAPDGATLFASLPYEGQVVAVSRLANGTHAVTSRVDAGGLPRGLTFAPGLAEHGPSVIVSNQHGEARRIPVVEGATGLALDVAAATAIRLRDANPGEFKDSFGATHHFRRRTLVPTRSLAVAVNPENGGVHVAHVLAAPGTPTDLLPVAGNTRSSALLSDGGGYGSSSGPSSSSRTFDVPVRPVEVTVTTIPAGADASAPIEPSLVVRDPASGEPLLHRVDQPADIRHHPAMSLLFVVGEGTDNVLVLSTAEGDAARSPVALIDVGRAPRGIALSEDGTKAWVLNGFDFSVSEIDLAPLLGMTPVAPREVLARRPDDPDIGVPLPVMPPEPSPDEPGPTAIGEDQSPESVRVEPLTLAAARTATFAADPWPSELRLGARIFMHARNESISHAGQFACATCHFDGTEDGVTWITPDGVRQTIALNGRLDGTGPFNWNGSEDVLQHNMDKTISRMGGDGLEPLELRALERFLLEGLPAAPNPYRSPSGDLTELEAWGQQVFNDPDVGCATCHRPEQRFMDGRAHDVGTVHPAEVLRWEAAVLEDPTLPHPGRRNTPSLEGLFYTAPYLSDGSARTLREVFDRTRDTMGHTSHLSEEELEALVAYLKTL